MKANRKWSDWASGIALAGWLSIFFLIGCENAPQSSSGAPQSPSEAPPSPPPPKASPQVVQMIKAASRGNSEGNDITALRFFLANKDHLSPQDVDYIADHLYDNFIKGFITSEYYAKPLTSTNLPPLQLEDAK